MIILHADGTMEDHTTPEDYIREAEARIRQEFEGRIKALESEIETLRVRVADLEDGM